MELTPEQQDKLRTWQWHQECFSREQAKNKGLAQRLAAFIKNYPGAEEQMQKLAELFPGKSTVHSLNALEALLGQAGYPYNIPFDYDRPVIDWSNSKTGEMEFWKNPLIPVTDCLAIADGAVAFRDAIIKQLREQREEIPGLRKKVADLTDVVAKDREAIQQINALLWNDDSPHLKTDIGKIVSAQLSYQFNKVIQPQAVEEGFEPVSAFMDAYGKSLEKQFVEDTTDWITYVIPENKTHLNDLEHVVAQFLMDYQKEKPLRYIGDRITFDVSLSQMERNGMGKWVYMDATLPVRLVTINKKTNAAVIINAAHPGCSIDYKNTVQELIEFWMVFKPQDMISGEEAKRILENTPYIRDIVAS